jgi:hypothetical protein
MKEQKDPTLATRKNKTAHLHFNNEPKIDFKTQLKSEEAVNSKMSSSSETQKLSAHIPFQKNNGPFPRHQEHFPPLAAVCSSAHQVCPSTAGGARIHIR